MSLPAVIFEQEHKPQPQRRTGQLDEPRTSSHICHVFLHSCCLTEPQKTQQANKQTKMPQIWNQYSHREAVCKIYGMPVILPRQKTDVQLVLSLLCKLVKINRWAETLNQEIIPTSSHCINASLFSLADSFKPHESFMLFMHVNTCTLVCERNSLFFSP